MGRHDWYRKTTWTPAEEADFEARLKRSRGYGNKAQYLAVQAHSLLGTGKPGTAEIALRLYDRYLREFPNERLQLSTVWLFRAETLLDLGRREEALASYHASLAARDQYPSVRHDGHLAYGEFVVALGREDLYDRVLALLDDPRDLPMFPIQLFRAAALRAFIAEARGEKRAAMYARVALAAAEKTESPFRYHRRLGVVDKGAADVAARLKRLAALADG